MSESLPACVGQGSAISKKGAFRASRPPVLSESMIPTGSTITAKIMDISIPKDSKFKSPMLTLETENGMNFQIPFWASIKNVVGETKEEQKECIGRIISITKLGVKKSRNFDRDFQVFDVVIQ